MHNALSYFGDGVGARVRVSRANLHQFLTQSLAKSGIQRTAESIGWIRYKFGELELFLYFFRNIAELVFLLKLLYVNIEQNNMAVKTF